MNTRPTPTHPHAHPHTQAAKKKKKSDDTKVAQCILRARHGTVFSAYNAWKGKVALRGRIRSLTAKVLNHTQGATFRQWKIFRVNSRQGRLSASATTIGRIARGYLGRARAERLRSGLLGRRRRAIHQAVLHRRHSQRSKSVTDPAQIFFKYSSDKLDRLKEELRAFQTCKKV